MRTLAIRYYAPINRYVSAAYSTALKAAVYLRPIRDALSLSAADERIAPKTTFSIAIEKGGLSVAYGSRSFSRIRIKGMKRFKFKEPGYPLPKDVAAAVALAAKEFKTPKSDIILGIPRVWSIIRTADFPSTIRDNMANVVAYDFERLIPINLVDAIYDYRILKEDARTITLVITAAKAEPINAYLAALREEGFEVTNVTTNLSGLGALCEYVNTTGKAPVIGSGKQALIFLEVGEDGYEGALYLGNATAGPSAGHIPNRPGNPEVKRWNRRSYPSSISQGDTAHRPASWHWQKIKTVPSSRRSLRHSRKKQACR